MFGLDSETNQTYDRGGKGNDSLYDHASNVSIVLQTTLRTANVDRLNPWLIRASQYLSQYREPGFPLCLIRTCLQLSTLPSMVV
jgi:hypothetical protein